MDKITNIFLETADVEWAIQSANVSIKKWTEQAGYYNNQFNSHFKGKLGELAVEKYLSEKGYDLDSHFRFLERENLSDLVIKLKKYTNIRRIEVKTWGAKYWKELGRCIAVDQYPDLKKKADVILWCTINVDRIETLVKKPSVVSIMIMGWSKIEEIDNAPVKDTGTGAMRKVKNYQLDEADLHPIDEFMN